MTIEVDSLGRNVYVVDATAHVPNVDIERLHMDPESAPIFRDIGKYESFDRVAPNVVVASWKVRTGVLWMRGEATMTIRKTMLKNGVVKFESVDPSYIKTEGTWTVDSDSETLRIRQVLALPVPRWIPRGFVKRGIRSRFEAVFDDIKK